MLNLCAVSSMEKVLPKFKYTVDIKNEFSGLEDEKISFQVVYYGDVQDIYKFKIESDSEVEIESYFVKNVAVNLPTFTYANEDTNYISHEPGIYPDILAPVDRDWVQVGNVCQSIWVSVKGKSGAHKITVSFWSNNGDLAASTDVNINIIPAVLPEQELKFTQWFHTDCISSHYKYDVFSEEHWAMIEKFLRMACDNGINMILTPVFTPALDTEIGGERPTVQLMKVKKNNDNYEFDFSLLRRWISLCKDIGFRYFEMPHLFTQWGAGFTPKIVAEEDGTQKNIFGWHVDSLSPEYDNFLSQFLPQLIEVLKQEEVFENSYFHISDEPEKYNMESYAKAKSVADKYLNGCKIIDALSDFSLYEDGIIKIPVPSTNHIAPFLEAELQEHWCYYCCVQCIDVSNRFVAMPSARNRSIGVQLYKYHMNGFLHWGYNFYYSRYSKLKLDPFLENDAYGSFPAGDSFSVYPAESGPIPAISLIVFNEALQDLRALKLLENYMGFEATVSFIEDLLGGEIAFDRCFSADAILRMREGVNQKIQELCN